MNADARALEARLDNGGTRGTGAIGGVQAGYNWQRGGVVFGLETDISWLDLHETRNTGLVTVGMRTGETADEIDSHWLYTLRPRIGLAFDRALIYGTGGLAVANWRFSHIQTWDFPDGCPTIGTQQFCHLGKTSDTVATWTAGAGVEYAFLNNVSLKAEYLWVDGPDQSFTSLNTGTVAGQPVFHSVDISGISIVRFGFNVKFQ
jgi:outer membrane immunogenic protein